jgi:hypothetical protein
MSNDNDIDPILKKFIIKINIENEYFIFLYFYGNKNINP